MHADRDRKKQSKLNADGESSGSRQQQSGRNYRRVVHRRSQQTIDAQAHDEDLKPSQ